MLRQTVICLAFFVLAACREDNDRQEVLNKLRPLGVSSSPVIPEPGQVVSLTFHTATPKGVALSYEPAVAGDRFGTALPVPDLALGVESVTDVASFSYHTMVASFIVPPAAVLAILPGQSRRFRYNIKIFGGDEATTVVGDVVVFGSGAPETAWLGVTAKIRSPEGVQGTSAEVSMSADLQRPETHEEDYKIGWFVGGGEVKNRRARETTWKTPDESGTYTVVFTARGKKTKAFAIDVMDMLVQ